MSACKLVRRSAGPRAGAGLPGPARRRAFLAALAFGLGLLLAGLIPGSGQAAAQEEVTIGMARRAAARIDLALPRFLNPAADPALAPVIDEIREVLWNDLEFSGLFNLIDRRFYAYIPPYNLSRPVFEDWEGIGAAAFLLGSLRRQAGKAGRTVYSADAMLFDVKSRQRTLGKNYDSAKVRLLGHTIADEIIRHYTGVPGIGSTKIAFVSDRDGNKELYVMDWDGHEPRRLTSNRSLDLSPAWSPDGSRLAYVSYKRGSPEIFVFDVYAGRETLFAGGTGASFFTPAWSPDGRGLAFSSSLDGRSEIYLRQTGGQEMQRLTFSRSIEVSPSFSPDGRRLAFNSSRGGSPQIFVMGVDGLNVERVSLGEDLGGYNSCPAWAPEGSRIAFCSRKEGYFQIFTVDVATGELRRLTVGPANNEEPCWSPDGRHIAFTSDRGGRRQVYLMNADGSSQRAVTNEGNNSAPAWSPR